MKVTQWFGSRIKPAHVGEYEVKRGHVYKNYPWHTFLYWDGEEWAHTKHSSNGEFVGSFASMRDGDSWRGIADDSCCGI